MRAALNLREVADAAPAPSLTRRERELLGLLARGVTSTAALAEAMCCSPITIKFHTRRAFAKLGTHDRVSAAVWAARHIAQ